MLSVILSRSTVVNLIVKRAAVFFQMPQVHVFRALLFFVGVVNEDIETVRVGVSRHNRKELLFMKDNHLLNSRAE